VPASTPTILALDFDGVLCDGMSEYFWTAWRAWRRLRPSVAPDPPHGLFDRFARVRPVVERGWEMPLVIMALLSGAREAEILERWRPEALLGELGHARDEVAAVLDGVRDEWIAADEGDWLDQHRFYPGAIQRLRRLTGGPTRVVIVTTKEGRFARKLLVRQGLDLGVEDVYGKEAGQPKPVIVRELVEARSPARSLWFVEDRLKTLEAVKSTPGLDEVGLFLAGWGYNTPRDREAARADSRVVLLSLERFTGDFPAWVKA
jgi:phosphoglycolate phosphatase-like HAD superfamily hydrolase